MSMFERFTSRARRVIDLAELEARELDHTYVGTEHILLGLIREEDGVAAKALESLGVSLEAARQRVKELLLGDETMRESLLIVKEDEAARPGP